MSDKTNRYSPGRAAKWQLDNYPDRPWMATANRRLSFRKINRLIGDKPPTVVLLTGYRVFLFKTGNDRDTFVENFHRGYEAKVYAPLT